MSQPVLHYVRSGEPPRERPCIFAVLSAICSGLCVILLVGSLILLPRRTYDVFAPPRLAPEVRVGMWWTFLTVGVGVIGVQIAILGLVLGRARRASSIFLFINALCLVIAYLWLIV